MINSGLPTKSHLVKLNPKHAKIGTPENNKNPIIQGDKNAYAVILSLALLLNFKAHVALIFF